MPRDVDGACQDWQKAYQLGMEKLMNITLTIANKKRYEQFITLVLSLMTCGLFAQDVAFKKGNFKDDKAGLKKPKPTNRVTNG